MSGGKKHGRRVMTVEQFEKMVDKYYERGTDRLRLRGDSHKPRQFIFAEAGYSAKASDPAAMACAQRCQGMWPRPNMFDQSKTMILMDGNYVPGDTYEGAPAGYFLAPESPDRTFVFHTGTIYTNVQVRIVACTPACLVLVSQLCLSLKTDLDSLFCAC